MQLLQQSTHSRRHNDVPDTHQLPSRHRNSKLFRLHILVVLYLQFSGLAPWIHRKGSLLATRTSLKVDSET